MKKILTTIALTITTSPILANDIQTVTPPIAPVMPATSMMIPKTPAMQIPQMPMPNRNQVYANHNTSNWNIPNMNWGNNGSNWTMPNLHWGNGNGSSWTMPTMHWGNGNGSSWTMPSMHWGNGSRWNVPSINWGNHWAGIPNTNWGNNTWGWNGVPAYMPAPIAPKIPMIQPSAPQLKTPVPSVFTATEKTNTHLVQRNNELSSIELMRHKIEQMQRLNASIAKQLANKKRPSKEMATKPSKVEATVVAK